MSIISTIKINNEYYDPGETVELSYVTGSGDDAKTHQIELQRLKHVKKGHFIYAELKNAKNKFVAAIYLPEKITGDPPNQVDSIRSKGKLISNIPNMMVDGYLENIEKNDVHSFKCFSIKNKLSDNVIEPFTKTEDYLIVDDNTLFLKRDIIWDYDDLYYTNNFPVKNVTRYVVEPKKPISKFVNLINFSLVIGYILCAFSEILINFDFYPLGHYVKFSEYLFFPVGIAAWAILVFGRHFILHNAAKLIATGFCFYICSILVQNMLMETVLKNSNVYLMGYQLLCILIPCVLFVLSNKIYASFSAAATGTALTTIILFSIGILFYSMVDEYWWGSGFLWYLGDTPYGYFWATLFVFWFFSKYIDFDNVPMKSIEFGAQLKEISAQLANKSSAKTVKKNNLDKAHALTDDIVDALKISNDNRVLIHHGYIEPFENILLILDMLRKQQNNQSNDDNKLVYRELAVLSNDINQFSQHFEDSPSGREPMSLRISPELVNQQRHSLAS